MEVFLWQMAVVVMLVANGVVWTLAVVYYRKVRAIRSVRTQCERKGNDMSDSELDRVMKRNVLLVIENDHLRDNSIA